jgi:hypothetical protein
VCVSEREGGGRERGGERVCDFISERANGR